MRIFLLVIALLTSSSSSATTVCPEEYPKERMKLSTFKGWKATVRDNYQLRAAGAMDGPVEGMGFLKPRSREFKDGYEETYDLRQADKKWFWCAYGSDVNLLLSKQLSPSTTRCTVTYKRTLPALKNHYEVTRINCN
jgi:hypothetical protein